MKKSEVAKFENLMRRAIKEATPNKAGAPVNPFLHFCWLYQESLVSALMLAARDERG